MNDQARMARMDQGLTRMDQKRKKSSQSSSLSEEDENSVSSSNSKNVLIKKGVPSKR